MKDYLEEPEGRKIIKEIIREIIREEFYLEISGRTIMIDGSHVLDNVVLTVTMNGEYVCGGDCY